MILICYNLRMKKISFVTGLTVITLGFGLQTEALNVVYPNSKEVSIDSNSTFIVGSADPKKQLTINGALVEVHPSGGFAKTVQLGSETNTFTLQSGDETLIYNIKRTPKTTTVTSPTLIEFEGMKYASVTKNNSPLRSTPIDEGINRIAHLQKGIPLVIDGEQEGFFRVILGANKEGWIAKDNVKIENIGSSLAKVDGYDYIDTKEFFIFVFHLNRQTPWEIVEDDPFLIKLYNVENQPNNTYIMDFPLNEALNGKKLLGYSAHFSGTDFIVKIRKPVLTDSKKPLKNIRVTIDPGHGGKEIGTTGCLGDKEKDVNLEFAKELIQELQERGAQVSATRLSDIYVDINDRVEFANSENTMVLISLHGNALPDNKDPMKYSGTEIYYYYNQAKPLADNIMTSMTKKLGVKNNGIYQQSFAIVRNTNALSLLIEVGYLINPSDNVNLINKDFQKKTAKAIADGLEKFFKQ